GSTALTADGTSGARLSEIRYKPWGESRYTFGATPTQRRFTGQVLDNVAGGLYFYNARYYDPALGRFTQADTLIPQPQNPQNLNRYSYALGNPLRFSDPTGRFSEDEIEAYLRNQYGEQWKSYWDAWYSDQVFWQMLELADYDDVLFAPTTSLTSGTFTHAGGTFDFVSQHDLYEYQGYGPYRLTNGQGTTDKLDAQTSITAHPVDTDSPRYQTWEQPLYRYDSKGPHYSGYNRIVSYQFSSVGLQLDAGSGLPWLGTYAAPRLVNGIVTRLGAGALCGPLCMFAITLGSGAGFANGAVSLRYETQVDLADKRTFLQANDVCYPPPQDESANLWK
ncbi:MAG: RHS repeat-associated core domain-containing protein, partial [Anaerolineae bacterium]